MANFADAIEKITREEISPTIRDATIEMEPFFSEVIEDAISATREGLGRDWKVIHPFVTSLAGAIQPLPSAYIEGETLQYGTGAGEPSIEFQTGSVTGWPTIGDAMSPGYMWRTLQLVRWRGNLFFPIDLLRADRLSANLGSSVGMILKQSGRNTAWQRVNNFMAPDATHKYLGKIAAISSDTDYDGTTDCRSLKVTLAADSRMRRFAPGMLVEVRDATNSYALCNNATHPNLVVRAVNPNTGEIWMEHTYSSSTYFAAAVAVDDIIVLKNSHSGAVGYGPYGLRSWMLNSGTFAGINLANYPQFQSVIVANSPATALTDDILKKYLGQFQDSHTPNQWPDTLLTTSGVLADYVGENDSLRRFQTQNASLKVKGGFGAGTSFEFDGQAYNFRTSAMMPEGQMWAFKLRNNIKRYVPPSLPGAGSNSSFSGDVEFVAPLFGSKSIYLPVRKDDAVTPYVEAPYEIIEQYAPEEMAGIVISGLTSYSVA